MNIAVDIDDTLTDSFDYFQPFAAEFFGADLESLKKRNISYSNLPAEWKSRELDFFRAYYDNVVENTPFKPNAASAIKKLKSAGHRIIIITGRTNDFYSDPYKTTEAELKNGAVVYDKLLCTLDKAEACRREKIDVIIDDLPANLKATEESGAYPILFCGKGNQGVKCDYAKAFDWNDAVRIVFEYSKIKNNKY